MKSLDTETTGYESHKTSSILKVHSISQHAISKTHFKPVFSLYMPTKILYNNNNIFLLIMITIPTIKNNNNNNLLKQSSLHHIVIIIILIMITIPTI